MAHWAKPLLAALAVLSSVGATPPLYRITASDHYSAGVQHGRLARERIRGWLRSDEMVALRNFTARAGAGRDALEAMKRDNRAAYPELAAELRGIAAGARVPEDAVWTATLISELESLQPDARGRAPAGHCTDVYAVGEGGARAGFAHGHNEDWPGVVSEYWYFVAYDGGGGALARCAGLVYPGALVGWAPTWNDEGMYLTQNSLFPKVARAGGLGSAFVQRDAICGASASRRGFDAVARGLGGGNWSAAASINLVDLRERRMGNVEAHLDATGSYALATARAANYSHMNMFKELEVGVADDPEPSTLRRQARVDALPPARTADDIRAILSDDADPVYPIYRDMTLTTLVLDGLTGKMRVWCGTSAMGGEPVFEWDLLNFWREEPPRVTTAAGAHG